MSPPRPSPCRSDPATAWPLSVGRGLVLALMVACAPGESTPDTPVQTFHDAPLGFVATEDIPFPPPKKWEREEDRSHAPYHLLVRVYRFADLAPLPIVPGQLLVPSMTHARQVSAHEVLCEGITLGSVSVTLADDPEHVNIGAIPSPRVNDKRPALAARNPVPLARHAVTTCDLFVVTEEDAQQQTEIRGRVVDRFTGQPVEGARVELPNGDYVQSDRDGRFVFSRTYPLLALFSVVLAREGYEPTRVTANSLSMTWITAWRQSGEATFTLRRSRR